MNTSETSPPVNRGTLPDEKVLERIQKLLNLAAKNSSEAEATQAAAKAQELLAEYNLTVETLGEATAAKDGKREEAKVDGGFYKYQRQLWKAVAELNFCLHWVQEYDVFTKSKRVGTGRARFTTEGYVTKKRHALIGKIVNVRATIAMAQHLEKAIERVTEERLGLRITNQQFTHISNVNQLKFSRWAVSFRSGAARRVREQLEDRRRAAEEARLKKLRADQARAERAGVSTATTLTLADVAEQERAANVDFKYGDGTSARWAQERAEKAQREREEDEAYTKWAEAHPEEAAAEAEKARKAARRSYGRGGSAKSDYDSGAYWSGYDEGAAIGLSDQVDSAKKPVAMIGGKK